MEEKAINKQERRISDTALFIICMVLTIGIGLAVAYSSGILGGVKGIMVAPFTTYDWLVKALPPVLFFHLALALFLAIRENVYTDSNKAVRAWFWTFWMLCAIATAILPYFVFHDMVVAGYIVSSIAGGLALGSTILAYQQNIGAGVVMTIFTAVMSLIMIYLGYWAFA